MPASALVQRLEAARDRERSARRVGRAHRARAQPVDQAPTGGMLENGERGLVADVVDLQQARSSDLRRARSGLLECAARCLVGHERRVEQLYEHRAIEHSVASEPHGSERARPLDAFERVPIAEDVARRGRRVFRRRHCTRPSCVDFAVAKRVRNPMC